MKSRERVLKAMLRKEPDRVPILCHTPEIQELLENILVGRLMLIVLLVMMQYSMVWNVLCLTELSRKEKLAKLNGID